MGSIYIYDVGTAPFRAPWALYRGSEDIGGLRDDLLAIVDEPEFADTESNILRDAQGSDEYDLYRDLVDRKIDYFLIATGGSMGQLVAVRSKDDFRRFVDHMDDHYAADVYVGEDEDRRLVRASSGKFVYHNPGLTEDFLTTVQVFMPKADYPSKERQWVDRRRFEDILEGGNPIKVDPEFPYVRDVALEVIQDQPYGGLWTSSLMKTSDGRYTTDWQDWCEQNMPYWVSKGCALLSINPDARIYTIDGVEDYHRLRDMYPYPLYRRHGRQKRLGHSVDWEAMAQDYDGVHHERGMAHQVRSTLWLNPGRVLKLIRYSKVLEASRETDSLDRVIRKYTIADVPRGLKEGAIDFNPENRWRGGHPEYYRLYRTARSNPEEYTLIYESELDDFDEFEDFYGVDPETVDPWRIVRAVNLYITGRKEFYAGHLFNGQLVSALFVAPGYADCFSFDVAVHPQYQSRGLGADLVDTAIEVFEMYEDSKDGDFEYCVQVVNPHMKSLLERKGFYVVESTSAGDEWIMERSRT